MTLAGQQRRVTRDSAQHWKEGTDMARFLKSPMGIVTMVALLIVAGFATKVLAVNPGGVFEIDGNIHDDSFDPNDDWENLICKPVTGHAVVNTGVVNDPSPLTIFTQGGSKDKADVSEWKWTNGSVPDKDDIENSFAAKYVGSGTSFIFVGGTRFSNDGSANIGA